MAHYMIWADLEGGPPYPQPGDDGYFHTTVDGGTRLYVEMRRQGMLNPGGIPQGWLRRGADSDQVRRALKYAENDEYGAHDEPAPLELPESPEGGWHRFDQIAWLDEWAAWLTFLRGAVEHGGFVVP